MGRPQEMNQHLRLHHPDFVKNVKSKAAQLTRAQASNSPCRLCSKSYVRSHQCPIMMQMALLLLHAPSVEGVEDQIANELHCELCHVNFADLTQLHRH